MSRAVSGEGVKRAVALVAEPCGEELGLGCCWPSAGWAARGEGEREKGLGQFGLGREF